MTQQDLPSSTDPSGATVPSRKPHVTARDDARMYQASVDDADAFWGNEGKRADWIKPFPKVKNTSFEPGNIDIRWFENGTLDVSANCIDRHLGARGDRTAPLIAYYRNKGALSRVRAMGAIDEIAATLNSVVSQATA